MGGRPVGYLQSVEELNLGPPNTNPFSGREEDLNSRPPDYKPSALTTTITKLGRLQKNTTATGQRKTRSGRSRDYSDVIVSKSSIFKMFYVHP